MKSKIFLCLLTLGHLNYTYGMDNSVTEKNSTITICKYTGGAAGALIGFIAGYMLKKKIMYGITATHFKGESDEATSAGGITEKQQREIYSKLATPWWVDLLCQLGIPVAGYEIGEMFGIQFGRWFTNNNGL